MVFFWKSQTDQVFGFACFFCVYGFSCKQDREDSTVFQLQHFEAYDDEHSVEMTEAATAKLQLFTGTMRKRQKRKRKKRTKGQSNNTTKYKR